MLVVNKISPKFELHLWLALNALIHLSISVQHVCLLIHLVPAIKHSRISLFSTSHQDLASPSSMMSESLPLFSLIHPHEARQFLENERSRSSHPIETHRSQNKLYSYKIFSILFSTWPFHETKQPPTAAIATTVPANYDERADSSTQVTEPEDSYSEIYENLSHERS